VANGKLLKSGLFRDAWIQPAAGDAGGALGAALAAWHIYLEKDRSPEYGDSMKGALLGPAFTDSEISKFIRKEGLIAKYYQNFNALCNHAAQLINDGKVVGWFQGRMEYGPRALGNRSILADARNPSMQKRLNLKVKSREGFRPFAPSVLEEDADDYFQLQAASPYMLFVVPVKQERCNLNQPLPADKTMMERLYFQRSDIPAVTHLDYSARVQTVSRQTNPNFWQLIKAFKELTGYGIIINTSFNVRGEPIVSNPDEAYKCFMSTDMDVLILGNYFITKDNSQI
jgi:carbamoyltransferase